jgi:putative membrane protein
MKSFTLALAGAFALVAAAAWAQAPTDAQIASIVVTANQVDIDAGGLAAERGTHADVKAFGRMMQTDHAGVNKAAVELVTRLKVAPEDNPTSRSLKEGGDRNLAHLRTLSGTAFDRAYIAQEVAYHQAVLDALDKTLVPSARNADLKALLVKVRPAFVAHLERAKQIQTALGR